MILSRLQVATGLTISVLGILIYLAVSGYMVSAQEEGPLRLTGADVIDYDHDEIFVIQDAVRTISRGEKVGDGCKFTTRLDRAFGEAPKVSRTLAVNLATCEELREEGTLSPGDLEKIIKDDAAGWSAPQESNPGRSGLDAVRSRGSGLLSSPLSFPLNTAKFRTWWEEIFSLVLNYVESEIRWEIDTDNDVVIYNTGSLCRWAWFVPSGWTDEGGTCTWAYESSQTQVVVTATHEFDNSIFICDLNPFKQGAHTYYDPIKAGGTLIGSWGSQTSSVDGECAGSLHKHTLLY
ncbi:MAG: hypothetical protein IH872_07415 [Chloroflexi bacterium]|nr:hypothetical protein [Chloroflexota bacterium]